MRPRAGTAECPMPDDDTRETPTTAPDALTAQAPAGPTRRRRAAARPAGPPTESAASRSAPSAGAEPAAAELAPTVPATPAAAPTTAVAGAEAPLQDPELAGDPAEEPAPAARR